MSQTDPDRPRPRTQLRLHAKRTADPDTIRFVIAALGWSPDGRWTPEAPDGCPGKLAQLLEQGRLARIEVRGEQAHLTRCRPGDQWATLAPVCRTVILEEIDAVDDLARARNIVARSTGEVALSHGGGLRIVSLTDDAVQVAMDGACRGCPASERTLRDGVLHDLRRAGIDVSVLQVSGMSLCDADERYEQTFHAVGGGDGPVRPDPQRSDGWRRRWGAGGSGHPLRWLGHDRDR